MYLGNLGASSNVNGLKGILFVVVNLVFVSNFCEETVAISNLRREDSELGDGPDSRLSNYSTVSELVRAKQLEAVQLRFNLEAASLLPLVLR